MPSYTPEIHLTIDGTSLVSSVRKDCSYIKEAAVRFNLDTHFGQYVYAVKDAGNNQFLLKLKVIETRGTDRHPLDYFEKKLAGVDLQRYFKKPTPILDIEILD